MQQRPVLITNGRIVTMADGDHAEQPGDLLIADGVIKAILPPGSAIADAEVIAADGMLVMPGLIDTHRHTWQTQLRTVAADWTLFDYLVQMRSIYSGLYSPEDAYLGNLLGALESINAGITTIVDHSHLINSPEHADALIDGLEQSGIRGVFCYGFFVNPGPDPATAMDGPGWRYDDARRVRAGRLASDTGRIRFGISPQEPEAIAPETLHREIALARNLGAHTVSMHVAMGNYDGGGHVVRDLARSGLLGPDLLFVHGAALADDELDSIAAAGAGLSVTPETEMQMGMGFPVAFRARAHGVKTSLGIDIVSNYPADVFLQMRLALQSARACANRDLAERGQAPRRLGATVRDALRLGTLGGAEAIGQEARIGSIAPGKAADVIAVRVDGLHMTPSPTPIAAAVLGATAHDVTTVIVDGIVRKRDGVLLGVEMNALKGRLARSAERITEAHGRIDRAPIEAVWATVFPHLDT